MKRPLPKQLFETTERDMDEQIADAVAYAIKSNKNTVEIRPRNQSKTRLLLLAGGAIGLSYWLQKSQQPGKMIRDTTSMISKRMKRATDQTAEMIEEGGEEMAHRIEEGSEKAGEKIEETGEQTSEKTEEAGKKAAKKAEKSTGSPSNT